MREARTSSRGEENTQKGVGGNSRDRRAGSWRFWDGYKRRPSGRMTLYIPVWWISRVLKYQRKLWYRYITISDRV